MLVDLVDLSLDQSRLSKKMNNLLGGSVRMVVELVELRYNNSCLLSS